MRSVAPDSDGGRGRGSGVPWGSCLCRTIPIPASSRTRDPQRLVTTDGWPSIWATTGLVVVESDEDVLLYDTGHIPGAVKVDWHLELNDQVTRDYLDADEFAELCAAKGIGHDDTIVFYGDNFNWWAAYALWVFTLFGHADVRMLDGGRQKWIAEGREVTRDKPTRPRADYPVPRAQRRADPRLPRRGAWRTSPPAGRWSTCARRASTPASCCTCRTIRRRARCAAGTSRARSASRGSRPPTRTARSSRPTS